MENYKDHKDAVKSLSNDFKTHDSYKSLSEWLLEEIKGDSLVIKKKLKGSFEMFLKHHDNIPLSLINCNFIHTTLTGIYAVICKYCKRQDPLGKFCG